MSWEDRFATIVQDTERNIASLQRRLASCVYTCPPCSPPPPCLDPPRVPCRPCLPNPCGPCPPLTCYPACPPVCPAETKQELLKCHLRELEANARLKELHDVACPPQNTPCIVAIELRNSFKNWKAEVGQKLSNLQLDLRDQRLDTALIKKDRRVDKIKEELNQLRQYVCGEVEDVRKNLDGVRRNIEILREEIASPGSDLAKAERFREMMEEARECERRVQIMEEKRAQQIAEEELRNAPPPPVAFVGGRLGSGQAVTTELRDAVTVLQDQVDVMQEYVYGTKGGYQQVRRRSPDSPVATCHPTEVHERGPPFRSALQRTPTYPTSAPPRPMPPQQRGPGAVCPSCPDESDLGDPLRSSKPIPQMTNQSQRTYVPGDSCKMCSLPLGRDYCLPYTKDVNHCQTCQCAPQPITQLDITID